tara:strand:+ start:10046 stop:10438 length:393 start_codon:yes stop_codon:yes gene_type:complete
MNKQLGRFIVTGIGAVVTDLLVYQLLRFVIDVDVAKAIGFISGSILAYTANKIWTFEQTSKSNSELIRFIVLYTSTFGINVLINRISLTFIQFEYSIAFAFLAATATSTVLNFLGMKYFVFTKKTEGQTI